jgi:hypothetical protein
VRGWMARATLTQWRPVRRQLQTLVLGWEPMRIALSEDVRTIVRPQIRGSDSPAPGWMAWATLTQWRPVTSGLKHLAGLGADAHRAQRGR